MKLLGILCGAWCLLAALALSLVPARAIAASPATGAALRSSVRETLIAARKQPQPDTASVQKLTKLYRTLQVDTSLTHSERESLRLAVRARLKAWAVRLEHTVRQEQTPAQQAAGRPVSKRLPAPRKPGAGTVPAQVLAQQGLPGAAQQQAATQPPADHSQELLEVIQDTIAPDTWDARGGLGVIRFWPPGNALIVRQTGEVHEQLGGLLRDLRQ